MLTPPSYLLDAMHPANHKTIFLLDHTPYFGTTRDSLIEFDFNKSRGPGFIPLAPIAKSLWTCSVEAAVEYCRIVWDIFPTDKLIRFIVSDNKAHQINTWSPTQQNVPHLLNGLAAIGVPPVASQDVDFSIFHGIQSAVSAMCECSEQQHEKRTSLNENTVPVVNRCRIVCITAVNDKDCVTAIEDRLVMEIKQGNKIAASSDLLIQIDHCDLVILNVQPNSFDSIPKRRVTDQLDSETCNVKASGGLANKLTSIILRHYNLASTTVTGIPMKEEQNASSSANYDVEIFHPAKAHETLFKGSGVDINQIRTAKEGFDYSSVTLKWSTPRGCTAAEMHNCTAMHRITPVDVNSRPSSCLINFLLGGRSVMLEVIRRGGHKAMSHLLAAHAGQIYMHSLAIGRSPLEEPPSISEGPGGRVTDYRIPDFGAFMAENTLVPVRGGKSQGSTLKRTRPRLDRHTKFWPLTISSTVIFNYRHHLDPILNLMLLPELREADVIKCKQCIYSLISAEAKHEPLHFTSSSSSRGKNPKSVRDDQYKQLWTELEAFLRAHCITDKHINILNCLLEVRNKDPNSDGADKVELDQALKELNQLSAKTTERASVIRATTDSPISPDPTIHTRSLLEWWTSRQEVKQRPEFAGLATAVPLPGGVGLKAKLYANFFERTAQTGGKLPSKSARPVALEQ